MLRTGENKIKNRMHFMPGQIFSVLEPKAGCLVSELLSFPVPSRVDGKLDKCTLVSIVFLFQNLYNLML